MVAGLLIRTTNPDSWSRCPEAFSCEDDKVFITKLSCTKCSQEFLNIKTLGCDCENCLAERIACPFCGYLEQVPPLEVEK